MPQEIERKFLVTGEYKPQAYAHSRIVQGYISSVRGRTVRVRIRDERGFLTIKGASNESGTSRYEWEKEIPLCEARELLKLCEPGVIDKTRYLVRSGQHVFEVDEFYGENEGLTVAEVELSSEDEPFVKPAFIGREVTGDVRYYNSQLMKHPFTTWQQTNCMPYLFNRHGETLRLPAKRTGHLPFGHRILFTHRAFTA